MTSRAPAERGEVRSSLFIGESDRYPTHMDLVSILGDMASRITIDFAGETQSIDEGEELRFGRASGNELTVDSNPRLHRHLGLIHFRDQGWWLRNTGTKIPLNVLDKDSRSRSTVTSGREIPLTFDQCVITFSAGSTAYEIIIEIDKPDGPDHTFSPDMTVAGLTLDHAPLKGEQRLLAVAMCEPALRNPHAPIQVPSNKSIAARFEWPVTTLNRKLDRLCRKYDRAGVTGLVGRPGELASDRRRKLVEHLVGTGEVTATDLSLLDEFPV